MIILSLVSSAGFIIWTRRRLTPL